MASFVVTGGAGFIGSHLADALLRRGLQVRILDDFSTGLRGNLDPRCEVVSGDVRDPALVRDMMNGCAGCFHLAAVASVARSTEDWLGAHQVNQSGTVAVLDAARAVGPVPVVFASSAAVYGEAHSGPAAETMRPWPKTAYGADKLGSELHAGVAWAAFGVPTTGLRFFNVYGPRQDPNSPYSGVISIFARRLAAGQPVRIHGDGAQTRDFVSVADVVAHLLAAMDRLGRGAGGAEIANVCTGQETSIRELATTIGALTGGETHLEFGPRRTGDVLRSVGDPAHAEALLGLRAELGLRDGLAALLGATPFGPAA